MNEYKPIKIKRKKRADSQMIRALIYRVVPIVLVVVIAICSFSIFDKRISEILADTKYAKLANRGNIDDPTLDTYDPLKIDWSSLYSTTGKDGFDPLLLSPLQETTGMLPSELLSSSQFEQALGYTNKQSMLWSINQSINQDITAWIYMYGMGINYPVAEEGDKTDYYLKHSYDGTPSTSGTIFMSSACGINPISKNLILHGHNMRDGTMFATLQNYLAGTRSFYDSHKYIFLDTLYGTYRYEIYSVYKCTPDNIYLHVNFDTNSSFISWCNQTNNLGLFKDPNIVFSPSDRILTLSTCDASNKYRIVVHARMVYPIPVGDINNENTPDLLPEETLNITNTPPIIIDPVPESTATPLATIAPTPTPTLPVATPSTDEAFKEGSVYRVKLTDPKSTLRLRSKPSTNSVIEAALAHGTKVTILSTVDNDWVKIKTEGGMEGYLQKRFLVTENEFSYTTSTDAIQAPSSNLITPTPSA